MLCAETLEHVRDVQLLLSEARRVLRPGGRLAVTTPAHSRATGVAIVARGFEPRFDPLSPHLRFLTSRSLRNLLEELGFDVRVAQAPAGQPAGAGDPLSGTSAPAAWRPRAPQPPCAPPP